MKHLLIINICFIYRIYLSFTLDQAINYSLKVLMKATSEAELNVQIYISKLCKISILFFIQSNQQLYCSLNILCSLGSPFFLFWNPSFSIHTSFKKVDVSMFTVAKLNYLQNSFPRVLQEIHSVCILTVSRTRMRTLIFNHIFSVVYLYISPQQMTSPFGTAILLFIFIYTTTFPGLGTQLAHDKS